MSIINIKVEASSDTEECEDVPNETGELTPIKTEVLPDNYVDIKVEPYYVECVSNSNDKRIKEEMEIKIDPLLFQGKDSAPDIYGNLLKFLFLL